MSPKTFAAIAGMTLSLTLIASARRGENRARPQPGRRTSKTFPGLALDLNKLCSTLARRPAADWAPANDGTSSTARTARRFNSAWLRP